VIILMPIGLLLKIIGAIIRLVLPFDPDTVNGDLTPVWYGTLFFGGIFGFILVCTFTEAQFGAPGIIVLTLITLILPLFIGPRLFRDDVYGWKAFLVLSIPTIFLVIYLAGYKGDPSDTAAPAPQPVPVSAQVQVTQPAPPPATASATARVYNGGNVRPAPWGEPILDQIHAGETVALLKRTEDSTWYYMRNARDITGWVHTSLLVQEDLSVDVPVATP